MHLQEARCGFRNKGQMAVLLPLTFLLLGMISSVKAQVGSYREAPALTAMVEAGRLPPVHERLPENPMVVEPVEQVGSYGGTWRNALVGGSDTGTLTRTIGYENLVRWTPDWEGVIPNVAESFDVNDNATEFTFHLREGLKWSDGHPYTADDIMFWYEDFFMNAELNPSQTGQYLGGELIAVEKVDNFTVIFRFAEPHGLFLQELATPSGASPTVYPRHYLEQFHASYNTESLDQLVQEAGAADWISLFQSRVGDGSDHGTRFSNREIPTLFGWILTTAYGEGARITAERNPFYWKVDPEGNQLPYIDRVVFDLLGDAEVALLRVLNGEIEMMDRHVATPTNKPIIFDNQERGDYHLITITPTMPNVAVIQLNLNHPDAIKREIFNNKDFRTGLSHAIDRQEIIDLVFVGQGEPHQAAPRPESELYNEQLAKQYTEYAIDLANEHLDRVLPEKDTEGFRLMADGSRFSFTLELDAGRLTFLDIAELLQGYWQTVGVDVQVRSMDRSLWELRVRSNFEHDATIHTFGGGVGQAILLDPRYFFPLNNNSTYAAAWQTWYNNPTSSIAQEPPAEVRRQMELYDQLRTTADQDRQLELMREILEAAAEQFYVIGIATEGEGYGVVKNNFRNVREAIPNSFIYPHPAPTNPEQYFFGDLQ